MECPLRRPVLNGSSSLRLSAKGTPCYATTGWSSLPPHALPSIRQSTNTLEHQPFMPPPPRTNPASTTPYFNWCSSTNSFKANPFMHIPAATTPFSAHLLEFWIFHGSMPIFGWLERWPQKSLSIGPHRFRPPRRRGSSPHLWPARLWSSNLAATIPSTPNPCLH